MDKGIMARILPEWRQPFTMEGMKTLFSMLFKAVATALGLVLMAGLLLAGLLTAVIVLVWARLRGRPLPAVNLRWGRPGGFSGAGRAPAGEVVDIDAREVDGATASRAGTVRPALEEPGTR